MAWCLYGMVCDVWAVLPRPGDPPRASYHGTGETRERPRRLSSSSPSLSARILHGQEYRYLIQCGLDPVYLIHSPW